MKTLLFTTLLLIGMAAFSQSAKKYAAFAVDRNNYYGSNYGIATDMPGLKEAEKKALALCKEKGGTNCRIVLSFSGSGWGTYKVLDALKGDYYAWGAGNTKSEADAVAAKMAKEDGRSVPNDVVHYFTNKSDPSPANFIFNGMEQREDVLIGNSRAVAFSPDGSKLAIGNGGGYFGGGGYIRLYKMPEYKLIAYFPSTKGTPIGAVAFSPDGKTLASTEKNQIKFWDASNGTFIKSIETGYKEPTALCFSPDGKLVASAGTEKTEDARLWEVSSGKLLHSFTGHAFGVRTTSISPDNKLLATTSMDGTIKFWDTKTGAPVRTINANKSDLKEGIFSPDGKLFATVDYGGNNRIKIWDTKTGELIRELPGHGSMGLAIAFYKGSDKIISSGYNNTLKLWDITSGSELASVSTVFADKLAVSPLGLIASVGTGGLEVRVLNTEGQLELVKIKY